MTFLALLFAHLLGDYPLQGPFLSEMKGSRFLLLLTHCGIWTGCICVAGHLRGMHVDAESVFALFAIHLVADYAKAHGFYDHLAYRTRWRALMNPLGLPLMIDQLIHVAQLLLFLKIDG